MVHTNHNNTDHLIYNSVACKVLSLCNTQNIMERPLPELQELRTFGENRILFLVQSNRSDMIG